jgi:hypothetical protein
VADAGIEHSIDGRDAGATSDAVAPAFDFRPSNIPGDLLATPPAGPFIVDRGLCPSGAVNVQIDVDVDKGTIAGCSGLAADPSSLFRQTRQADGSPLAVLFATKVVIGPEVVVTLHGSSPFALIATETIEVAGRLEGAAHGYQGLLGSHSGLSGRKGDGMGPGAGAGASVGGGGGGGFCGRGGDGGQGNRGGGQNASAALVPLVGGSSGGNGQVWYAGAGGGAIELVAARAITITGSGVVHAGGAGGEHEGGGGGSGGAILLEAPAVAVAGILAVNGGGGGSGGLFGDDAHPNDEPAPGGAAIRLNTGEGGTGSAGLTLDGAPGNPNPTFVDGTFSGGGGGGAGYIRINGRDVRVTGILSPTFGTPCATQGVLTKE